MTAQLELRLDSRPGPARARLRLGLAAVGRLARRAWTTAGEWTPVWVPALLALQIAALGLVPALRESVRLDGDERVMGARESALLAESQTIERERLMLEDPIWRERVAKSRRKLDGEVLELAASRPATAANR
jgi:hypothetical protein